MINSLRRRFVLFSMLVISSIVVITTIFILIDGSSSRPAHAYAFTLILIIALVFIGSILLSKLAIRPIRAAWQAQLDFTADASHELRTPIAVIQTNLELVMDSPTESVQSQMRWLQNIDIANKRMARLVEDLLTLSRADSNQQMLEKESFSLNEALAEVLASFEAAANAKGIALELIADGGYSFYGDRKRIRQLVAILIDNALHYTLKGSITVSLGQSERGLSLTVSDTGSGIEAGDLPKIFDRFYRATRTRKLHQEGAGLGLAIAKWIVQEHGGSIKAESKAGEGTRVVLCLPDV